MDFVMNLDTGNTTANARMASEAFNDVAHSADNINSAFDPSMLEQYNARLTQIAESYSKLNRETTRQQQAQVNQMRQMQNVMGSMGGGVTAAGAGSLSGMGGAAGKGLTGLLSMIPGAGLAAAALVTGGMTALKLSETYMGRAETAGNIAAMQSGLGGDMMENTRALNRAMKDTAGYLTKFGKTYEEAGQATEAFLRAGGKDLEGTGMGAFAMAFPFANIANVARTSGTFQRYGGGNLTGMSTALMNMQGLEPAQIEEIMTGISDIFTEGLSRGVVRQSEDITRNLEFFGRAGSTWQGALGAQRVAGLNQVAAGAGHLQSQQDLMLYRAAQNVLGENASPLAIRKYLEQGMSADLFMGLGEEYKKFGYNREESIYALENQFGIGATAAEGLYGRWGGQGAVTDEDLAKAGIIKKGTGQTSTTVMNEFLQEIEDFIIRVGGGATTTGLAQAGTFASDMIDKIKNRDLATIGSTIHDALFEGGSVPVHIAEANAASRFRSSALANPIPGARQVMDLIMEAEGGGMSTQDIYSRIGAKYQEFAPGGFNAQERSELATLLGLVKDAVDNVTGAVKESSNTIEIDASNVYSHYNTNVPGMPH